MKFTIELRSESLNEQLKALVVQLYMQLKQIGQENKGVVMLLGLFGNPMMII